MLESEPNITTATHSALPTGFVAVIKATWVSLFILRIIIPFFPITLPAMWKSKWWLSINIVK
jgi:hypothetical protein